MTRRYDEPIEVTSAFADPDRADPEAFIWRGRLFVVRAVLDRWHERRVWWRETGMPDGARPPAPTRRTGVALAEPVAEASAEPVAETLAAPTGVGRSGDPTGGRRPDAPAGAGRTHAPAGAGGGDLVDGVGLGDAAADRERQ
ncbi:DUF6504 family protein, partial [Nostocoides japonicum]|uniref:DUF6504 family protein n=1 Tax=Nostocoides japonicum TaxID=99481 RepID=UPI00065C07E1